MAEKRDYYDVLGLPKTAGADDIKKAYRKLAKANHPDLHPDDKNAETRFKEINEAYEILSDPVKKSKYDQYGYAGVDPNFASTGGGWSGSYSDLGDIFGDIFGSGFGDIFGSGGRSRTRNGPQKGESIRTSVTISFEEAAFGCSRDVNITRVDKCDTCGGSGCADGTTPEVCPDCGGSGSVRQQQRTPFGVVSTTTTCPKCGGAGKIIHQPCPDCRGSGTKRVQKKISVNIPAGIDNGQSVSIRGQGSAGRNGGPAGDLLVSVRVSPSDVFTREGDDVLCSMPISFVQATLGAEVDVPTLDGKVKLTIPEGTQPGSVFRMRGKGITHLRGIGRGDQFVTIEVVVPKNLTREQKDALLAYEVTMEGVMPRADNGKNRRKKKK